MSQSENIISETKDVNETVVPSINHATEGSSVPPTEKPTESVSSEADSNRDSLNSDDFVKVDTADKIPHMEPFGVESVSDSAEKLIQTNQFVEPDFFVKEPLSSEFQEANSQVLHPIQPEMNIFNTEQSREVELSQEGKISPFESYIPNPSEDDPSRLMSSQEIDFLGSLTPTKPEDDDVNRFRDSPIDPLDLEPPFSQFTGKNLQHSEIFSSEFSPRNENTPSPIEELYQPKESTTLSLSKEPTQIVCEPGPSPSEHTLTFLESSLSPRTPTPPSLFLREATPPPREISPERESTPPPRESTSPPKEPTPPSSEFTLPPREPTPPPREPTLPPKEPTPPPKEPTPPPREPTPPPREPTPPPREPTPPPREPTPPPREPTPPPREPTPLPREPTPLPREPTPPPREPTPPPKEPTIPPREPTPPPREKETSRRDIPQTFDIIEELPSVKNVVKREVCQPLQDPFIAPSEKKNFRTSQSSSVKKSMALFIPSAWFNPDQLDPRVVNLIYWRDVKKSGITFGSLMIILLSLAYVSLISVVAYTSLTVLAGTIAFRIYKNIMQAVQKSQDGHPFKEFLDMDNTLPPEKVHEAADVFVAQLNSTLTELKRLFFVEDLIDSVKFGCLLWCLTYVGSWFNGLTLVIMSVVALFSLPKVYEQNQAQIDQYIGLVRTQVNDIMGKVKAAIPIGNKEKSQ